MLQKRATTIFNFAKPLHVSSMNVSTRNNISNKTRHNFQGEGSANAPTHQSHPSREKGASHSSTTAINVTSCAVAKTSPNSNNLRKRKTGIQTVTHSKPVYERYSSEKHSTQHATTHLLITWRRSACT